MKHLIKACVGLAAMASTPVLAADMAVKAPPRPLPPVTTYSWTGCYIGAGVGYKFWDAERDFVNTTTGLVAIQDGDSAGRGWLVRGQVGCDYQFANNWVIGAFGDYDWTNAKGDYFQRFGAPLTINTLGSRKEAWAWAAGARLGYVIAPNVLTFVSGGYTEAHFDPTDLVVSGGGATGLQIGGNTLRGVFVGSGFEYNVSFLPGLSLKTEYRYSWYDSRDSSISCVSTAPGVCGTLGPITFVDRAKLNQQSITTELVYRFGGSSGLTARY